MDFAMWISRFRRAGLAVRGLLVAGAVVMGIGGIGASEAGCRYRSSMSDLTRQESRLAQLTRGGGDAVSDDAETLGEYVKADGHRVMKARSDLGLWTVVAMIGAASLTAGSVMFVRGRS